jgi:hypothetical protein
MVKQTAELKGVHPSQIFSSPPEAAMKKENSERRRLARHRIHQRDKPVGV